MNLTKSMILLCAAAIVPAMPVHAATVEIESEGPVVELSIYETITADPDLVTIGAGVTSEASTAVAALRQNSEKMQAVIDRILALGVAEKDIQTTGINLNARYDYDRDRLPQFRGYQVSNRVRVKLREIDETGEVLDALVVAGATDLSGPTFSIEDDEAAKETARLRAIERGTRRAQAYATALGYTGVRVLQVSEVIQGYGPPPPPMARTESAIVVTGASAPVQPGQVSTGVQITITYEMTGGEAG